MRDFSQEVENDFAYHKLDGEGEAKCKMIRAFYLDLGRYLVQNCPHNKELAVALTLLRQSKNCAVEAVAVQYPVEE
jgi:hypothetical protein